VNFSSFEYYLFLCDRSQFSGTGGDEAGLFAGEMLRMYERYSNLRNWKFETLNVSGDVLGIIKVGDV
jgi:protein subunit release factor A